MLPKYKRHNMDNTYKQFVQFFNHSLLYNPLHIIFSFENILLQLFVLLLQFCYFFSFVQIFVTICSHCPSRSIQFFNRITFL